MVVISSETSELSKDNVTSQKTWTSINSRCDNLWLRNTFISSALQMEEPGSSDIYEGTRRHTPQDRNFNFNRSDYRKSNSP
jgi:hypothetical protein